MQEKNDIIRIKKDDPLVEYIRKIMNIITLDDKKYKPYLNTNQNLQYMSNILTGNESKAFTILSAGTSYINCC